METTLAPSALAQIDFRAELHQLIDQIQDEAVLRAALLLLAPQVATAEAEPKLSPAWQKELDAGIKELDEGKGILAAEAFARLHQHTAA